MCVLEMMWFLDSMVIICVLEAVSLFYPLGPDAKAYRFLIFCLGDIFLISTRQLRSGCDGGGT